MDRACRYFIASDLFMSPSEALGYIILIKFIAGVPADSSISMVKLMQQLSGDSEV